MSIFGKIKDAIFGRANAATPPAGGTTGTGTGTGTGNVAQGGGLAPQAQPTAPATAPTAVSEVDVEQSLATMGQGKDLNWRTSIVDLMKLLGIDSSLDNRKELARELGYTGELNGSAEMNIWLHKATMRELAANGGKVPPEMLA